MKLAKIVCLPLILTTATPLCFIGSTSCSPKMNENYLWISSNDCDIWIQFFGMSNYFCPKVEFSDDYGLTWWPINIGRPSVRCLKNKAIAIRGNNLDGLSNEHDQLQIDIRQRYPLMDNPKISLQGSLMSLIDNGTGTIDTVPSAYCFKGLFDHTFSEISDVDLTFPKTMKDYCFQNLFHGCDQIKWINVNFTDWNDNKNAFNNWLSSSFSSINVAAKGTFICPKELDTTQRDESHIPENWEIKNNK